MTLHLCAAPRFADHSPLLWAAYRRFKDRKLKREAELRRQLTTDPNAASIQILMDNSKMQTEIKELKQMITGMHVSGPAIWLSAPLTLLLPWLALQ
jgi:hypothetical protein